MIVCVCDCVCGCRRDVPSRGDNVSSSLYIHIASAPDTTIPPAAAMLASHHDGARCPKYHNPVVSVLATLIPQTWADWSRIRREAPPYKRPDPACTTPSLDVNTHPSPAASRPPTWPCPSSARQDVVALESTALSPVGGAPANQTTRSAKPGRWRAKARSRQQGPLGGHLRPHQALRRRLIPWTKYVVVVVASY